MWVEGYMWVEGVYLYIWVEGNMRVERGGIGYQVSDITSTKCSFGYFSLDTPTPFAVLTVFLDNT